MRLREAVPSYAETRVTAPIFPEFAMFDPFPNHDFDSVLSVVGVVALLTLSFLLDEPCPAPSCALRSRKPAHSSASDSLSRADDVSEKTSALREGELGVRWNGDAGRRRELLDVPGRARPACSLCSSVQLR